MMTCHQCTHYYVTWDPHFPHGCRAMGFKSRCYPIDAVRREMQGKDCLAFERKTLPAIPKAPVNIRSNTSKKNIEC
jgi:hypothetical protein